MKHKNSSTQRADLRNTLIANGYRPLPLAAKGVHIPGWSRAEITEDWLKPFHRQARYPNTGIRCDDLIALDIDVLDEALADEIEALAEDTLGETDFCRIGQWPKRLLLYRCKDTPERSARTGQYGGCMVELLCGPGRQFAAYGTHPGTGEAYAWESAEPATAPWKRLPAVRYTAAIEVLEACEEKLAASGLECQRRAHRWGQGAREVWDLLADTPVEANGERTTWGQLRDSLTTEGVFGNLWRAEYDDWGDSDAVHFFLSKGASEPCCHDFVHDTTHYESVWTPELGELLPEPPAPGQSQFVPDEMADLIENCVLLRDKTVRRLDRPMRSYSLEGFRAGFQHLRIPDPDPPKSNPNKTIPFMRQWEQDPATLRADFAALRPDHPRERLFCDGSETIMNTYRPPAHPSEGGEVETFYEFIAHLLPRPDEQALFLNWMAHKTRWPAVRMHGMVMVTQAFGTGRGTLVQIMERLFGDEYVSEVELGDLIGIGGQASFNAYLADSLMVTVSEALEEREGASRWSARHQAYERIKVVCDPVANKMHIRRKYGRNSTERVYASLFVSSNHVDALAIEPGDRRIIVLDNTETPLVEAKGQLYERLLAWRREPANIGALQRALLERAERAAYDATGAPPMTPAKARMVEAGQSDTDRLFEHFIAEAAGDVCTTAQWRAFANQARLKYDLDLPADPGRRDHALTAVLQRYGRRPASIAASGNLKVNGRVTRPWIIRNIERWLDSADRAGMVQEVLKNGDPGGSVLELPR